MDDFLKARHSKCMMHYALNWPNYLMKRFVFASLKVTLPSTLFENIYFTRKNIFLIIFSIENERFFYLRTFHSSLFLLIVLILVIVIIIEQ